MNIVVKGSFARRRSLTGWMLPEAELSATVGIDEDVDAE